MLSISPSGCAERMEELKKEFPEGVKYEIGYDTTPFIRDSIDDVVHTLFVAIGLVGLVVLVFLQNWRAVLIPMLAVPVAIVGTFAVMAIVGFSLNNISLFGLVLAIGIVVDDAIVVVENVERWLARGYAPRDAARNAMDEVAGPVIAVALVLCAVFVPCAFISGISGRFFRQFAVTIAASTVFSALNSLTLSPALAAVLLKPTARSSAKSSTQGGLAKEGPRRRDPLTWLLDIALGWFFRGFDRVFGIGTEGYGYVVGKLLREHAGVERVRGPADSHRRDVRSGAHRLRSFARSGPRDCRGRVARFGGPVAHASDDRKGRTDRAPHPRRRAHDHGQRRIVRAAGLRLEPWHDVHRARPVREAAQPGSDGRRHHGPAPQSMGAGDHGWAGAGVWGAADSGPERCRRLHADGRGPGRPRRRQFAEADRHADRKAPRAARFDRRLHGVPLQCSRDLSRYRSQEGRVAGRVVRRFEQDIGNLSGLFLRQQLQRVRPILGGHAAKRRSISLANRQHQSAASSQQPRTHGAAGHASAPRNVGGPVFVQRYNLYTAAPVTGNFAPGTSSGTEIAGIDATANASLPESMGSEWTQLVYLQIMEGNTTAVVFALSVLAVFLALSALYESWRCRWQ